MASEQQKQELEGKLLALIAREFQGDRRAAFGHYDADADGRINRDELRAYPKTPAAL
jgi:Ca2+-binding EF-hand superfamily protein